MNGHTVSADDLTAAQTRFVRRWKKAISRIAFEFDLRDIASDDEEAANDAIETRHHCGTCEANLAIGLLEPALLEYLRVLEGALSIPTTGRAI